MVVVLDEVSVERGKQHCHAAMQPWGFNPITTFIIGNM